MGLGVGLVVELGWLPRRTVAPAVEHVIQALVLVSLGKVASPVASVWVGLEGCGLGTNQAKP